MEYCIEQEQANTRFVSRTSWKDKIIKPIPENNCVFLNDGNGLHTFLRGSTALVGVALLIVEVSRSHSDTLHNVGLSGRAIGPSQRPLPSNTHKTLTGDRYS